MSSKVSTNKILAYNSQSFLDAPSTDVQMFQWQSLVNHIANILDVPTVMINQANDKGMEVLATNKNSVNPYEAGMTIPCNVNIYCHKVVRENAPLYVKDAHLHDTWHNNPELTQDQFNSYLGYPIQWPDGRVFGTICVMDQKASDYQDSFIELLKTFKQIIEFELALIESNQKLKSLCVIEEATGLYNRRGMLEAARQLIGLADRENKSIGVLYIDLDHLKLINDEYGHDAGDQLIRLSASTIKTVLRVNDIAARVGGDEFIILAVVDDQHSLDGLIERLLNIVKQTTLGFASTPRFLSMSIGSALGKLGSEKDLDSLIKQADKMMYEKKQALKQNV